MFEGLAPATELRDANGNAMPQALRSTLVRIIAEHQSKFTNGGTAAWPPTPLQRESFAAVSAGIEIR